MALRCFCDAASRGRYGGKMNTFGGTRTVLRDFMILVFAAVVFLGCYDGPKSKNPISEPDPHGFDQGLLGTWGLSIDGKQYAVVHFEIDDKKKGTIRAYLFNFRERETANVYYGHFSRAGDSRYLNLYEIPEAAPDLKEQTEKEPTSQKPLYFFIKYKIKGNKLSLAAMDNSFVAASVRKGEIKGLYAGFLFIIHDNSDQIAEYIRKHDKDVFSASLEFNGNSSLSKLKYQARELDILKQVKKWPLTKIHDADDYDQVIKAYPSDAVAYYDRAGAYKEKADFDRAIQDYTRAIGLNRKNSDYYRYRADAFKAKCDYDKAIEDYTRAIGLDPGNSAYYCYRADAFKAKGDYDKAIEDYTRAIDLKLPAGRAYGSRAEIYASRGDYDRAVQDYNMIIKGHPDLLPFYPDIYKDRGDAYAAKGEYSEAAHDYNKHGDRLFEEKGDYDSAIQSYTRAIELEPKDVFYTNRGNAFRAKGDYENALRDYTKAIELNPKDEHAYLWLTIASMKKSQQSYENAINELRGYVNNNPSQEWIRTISKYYLGMDGLTEGSVLSEAENTEKADERYARRSVAYYYLGEARWFKGDREGAAELFQASISNGSISSLAENVSAQANLKLLDKGKP